MTATQYYAASGMSRPSLLSRYIAEPPDVLDTIASLSSDEVATPPWLADKMLDLLPGEVFEDPDHRFLDPAVKTGVFLREVARRLLYGVDENDAKGRTPTRGLRDAMPAVTTEEATEVGWPDEVHHRRLHIFHKMLFGLPITELTAEMGRRTVYYTTDATSHWSVAPFARTCDPDGPAFSHDEHCPSETCAEAHEHSPSDCVQVDGECTTGHHRRDCPRACSSDHHDRCPDRCDEGGIRLLPAEHVFSHSGVAYFAKRAEEEGREGTCIYCGATTAMDRGPSRENHAYGFIHQAPLPQEFPVKFNVIVGNPPYQMTIPGSSDRSIYGEFVQRAIEMEPDHVLMITPSRYFVTGKGLEKFRPWMLSQRSLRSITHYPDWKECFPEAEIKGGVSYFWWEKKHRGPVDFTVVRAGKVESRSTRFLDEYDVFIRFNEAIGILDKIKKKEGASIDPHTGVGSLEEHFSSQTPFGFHTNFPGASEEERPGDVPIYHLRDKKRAVSFVPRDSVRRHKDWIDKHKVLMPYGGDGSADVPNRVTGQTWFAPGPSVCTQTFLVAGVFDDASEAANYQTYLRTKFVRYLMLLRKPTQHIKPSTLRFVPSLPMNETWTDERLYARYSLTDDEIEFIETQIKEMPAPGSAEAEPEQDDDSEEGAA